jgi:DNA-binding MarR family transcriptional regulator
MNVKEISAVIGVSYYYAVVMLPRLEARGLIVRKRQGRESIIRPNTQSPIVRAISRWKR